MALCIARTWIGSSMARPAKQARVVPVMRQGLPSRRFAPVRAATDDSTGLDTEDINKKLNETLGNTTAFLQDKWEETEDKPAAVAVTGAAILLLITLSGVVEAVDKIPIISDVIELVGIVVTGWFTYRYLVFGPDREELVSNIKAFLKKVYGK